MNSQRATNWLLAAILVILTIIAFHLQQIQECVTEMYKLELKQDIKELKQEQHTYESQAYFQQ